MARIDASFGRQAGVNAAQITPERRDNLEQLGRGVAALGAALEERRQFSKEVDRIRQDRADDLALTELSTRVTQDWAKRLDDEAAAYDGAEGGFGDRMRTTFGDLLEEEVKAQPARRQREARLTLLGVQQRQGLAAYEIEDSRRDAFVLREGVRQSDADANAVRTDPAFYETALDNHEKRLLAMPASLRGQYGDARRAIDLAYGEALIDRDPDDFLRQAKDGRFSKVDAGIVNQLVGSAEREKDRRARQEVADAKLAAAEARATLQAEIDGMNKAVEAGLPVSAKRLDNLAAVAAAGGPQAQAAYHEQAAIIRAMDYIQSAPFADSAAELAKERARLAAAGDTTSGEATIFSALAKAQAGVMRRAEQDFAGFLTDAQPDRIRPLRVEDMDAASLRYRAGQVDALADYYGVKTKTYFSDAERASLQRKFIDDPQGAVEAAAVISALPQGGAMLAELAPKAPELAHLGGLLAANGDEAFIDDATAGAARARKEGFKTALGRDAIAQARMGVSPAFALFPESGDAAIRSARYAYEERAARAGLSSDDFDPTLFNRVLQEAAGGVYDVRGRLRGGVQDYTALSYVGKALVPNWMENGDLKNWMRAITAADIDGATDNDGNPLRLSAVRRAFPVAVGDGRYQLAFGDPTSEPQWVKKGDAPFVIDFNRVRDRQAGPSREVQREIPAGIETELLGE